MLCIARTDRRGDAPRQKHQNCKDQSQKSNVQIQTPSLRGNLQEIPTLNSHTQGLHLNLPSLARTSLFVFDQNKQRLHSKEMEVSLHKLSINERVSYIRVILSLLCKWQSLQVRAISLQGLQAPSPVGSFWSLRSSLSVVLLSNVRPHRTHWTSTLFGYYARNRILCNHH